VPKIPDFPELPDIPGKGLIGGTTRRARLAVVAAAGATLAVGGVVAKRLLGHRGGADEEHDGDEQKAPSPTPSEATPAGPKPKAAKPGPPKPKAAPKPKPAKPADKPKAAKPAPAAEKPADKPKPAKPKAAGKPKPAAKPKAPKAKAAPKPPTTTGTDAPPKPEVEPGNISTDREHPHRALNNPVGDPDETEYPDPFEAREDPRDPVDPDDAPFGEPHPPTGAESTSEPPLEQDPEVPDGGRPPRREKLDD
jgi:translation initiation factor IF-2